MTEALIQFFSQFHLSGEAVAFLTSMLPFVELRGGIVIARLMEVPFATAFLVCYLGNMVPIPFILLFIRKIFKLMRKWRPFEKLITKIELRAMRKSDKVQKYRLMGLFIFVAIPLPGTGAWMGALVADLLDIQIKKALPAIAAGVLCAGIIMSILAYFFPSLFGFSVN